MLCPSLKALLIITILTVTISPAIITTQAITGGREPAKYPDGISLSGTTKTSITNANVTVIGWIELTDDATLIFNNCSIRLIVDPSIPTKLRGDITLQDRASLFFNNCSLLLKKDLRLNYHSGGSIYLNGTSRLVAVNTSLDCTDDMGIICYGDSKLSLSGVTYTGVPPRSSLHFGIEDYTFENLLAEFHEGHSITGVDKSIIHVANSKVGKVSVYENSTLILEDSKVVYYYEGASSIKSSLIRSDVRMYNLSRYNSSITMSAPLEGFHERWDSGEFYPSTVTQSGDLFVNSSINNVWLNLAYCETELINSKLKILAYYGGTLSATDSTVWLLEAGMNSHSTVSGSNIVYLLGYSPGDLDLTVSNTRVSTLLLTCKKTMKVSIADSTVENGYVNHRWWTPERGEINFTRTDVGNLSVAFTVLDLVPSRSTSIKFDDCFFTGSFTLWPIVAEKDELSISGGLRFGPISSLDERFGPGQLVSRSYIVRVYSGGEPLRNVSLRLVDANHTIWEGVTDETGSAVFNLTFTDKFDASGTRSFNMTSKYLLSTDYEGEVYSVEVGLLSDTPIEIGVRLSTRLESELLATVIIILLVMVSVMVISKTSLIRHLGGQ